MISCQSSKCYFIVGMKNSVDPDQLAEASWSESTLLSEEAIAIWKKKYLFENNLLLIDPSWTQVYRNE